MKNIWSGVVSIRCVSEMLKLRRAELFGFIDKRSSGGGAVRLLPQSTYYHEVKHQHR